MVCCKHIALDAHIDGSMSFIDLCDNVKNNCMEAFSHQTYPFDLIVKNLDIKRDSSRNPLFDVMFVYQNKTQSSFKLSEDINSQLYYPWLSFVKIWHNIRNNSIRWLLILAFWIFNRPIWWRLYK